MDNVCKNCRFVLLDGQNYFCRRYPPTVLFLPKPGLMSRSGVQDMVPAGVCPPVNGENGTCGEFSPKLQ